MKRFLRDSLQSYLYTITTAGKLNRKIGLPIGILSNHSEEWFAAISDKFKFRETFLDDQLIVVSQAVGLAKPDAEIFKLTLDRLRKRNPSIDPSQVLFIDDKKNNADAAAKFGFRALEFDASGSSEAEFHAKLAAFGLNVN